MSSGAQVTEGGVVSTIVKVAVVLLLNPSLSVAVKVTVAAPVSPHRSDNEIKSFVHVIGPQGSDAIAPALVVNQLVRSAELPLPSHSTVRSDAGTMMDGPTPSGHVTVAITKNPKPVGSELMMAGGIALPLIFTYAPFTVALIPITF